MREGCHVLIGAFDSGNINAMIQVIKQSSKPIPFVIDIGSADQLTQQGVKYVFRVFTTNSTMGRRGIEYLMQLFKDSGNSCKRAVMFQVSDPLGRWAERTMEWHKKLNALRGRRDHHPSGRYADLSTRWPRPRHRIPI
jgi:branched-chain amino acid transport system substrate-binding protein